MATFLRIIEISYSRFVPFHNLCSYCEHILVSNDEITPLDHTTVSVNAKPIPSFGAWYHLIGDGSHAPTFHSSFKKRDGSGTYDSTLNAINLIKFFYDGVNYWYEIIQPA